MSPQPSFTADPGDSYANGGAAAGTKAPGAVGGAAVSTVAAELQPGPGLHRRPELNLKNWQQAPFSRWGFSHVEELIPTAVISRAEVRHPETKYSNRLGAALPSLEEDLLQSDTDAFVVVHRGDIIFERYFGAATPNRRHILMSVSKSLCALVVGSLIGDGLIDTSKRVGAYLPELDQSAYGAATVQQVLDMTAAVVYDETYENPDSEVRVQDRVAGWHPRGENDPADTFQFLATLKQAGEHGVNFQYCSANTDVLAWLIERVTGERYSQVLSARLWAHLLPEEDAVVTVDSVGFPFANGGIACTARDLARVGLLMLAGGQAGDLQVVPASWVAETVAGGDTGAMVGTLFQRIHPHGSYRNQWWVPGDDRGTYHAVGIHGQYLWVDPSNETVIVKLSSLPEAVTESRNRFHAGLFDSVSKALD